MKALLFLPLTVALLAAGASAAAGHSTNAMRRIKLEPVQGTMSFAARAPAFPGDVFALTVPETIGDVEEVLLNFPGHEPRWTGPDAAGAIGYTLANDKVRFEARVVPFCDHLDVWQTITNLTDRTWRHAFSFSCCNPRPVLDKTFQRTYLATAEGPTRIADIPLTASTRPLQLYHLQGKQYPSHTFIDAFQATCATPAADSWIATVAADGRSVLGVAAQEAAFLFSNSEFGCIHSAPDFGDVPPGETRTRLMRVYAMPGDLQTFIRRQARGREALVPSLRAVQRDPAEIGMQAAEIWLPWRDAGHVTLRLPETLSSDLGLLFIDHSRPDMPPVTRADALPDWHCDAPTGALWYSLPLPNGVTFGGQLTPVANGADLLFWVTNHTDAPLTRLSPQFCLIENGAPPFSAGDLSRTYLRTGGRWLPLAATSHQVMAPDHEPWIIAGVADRGPRSGASMPGGWSVCRERADVPLIAAADADGHRVVGLTWRGGLSLMSNGRIPCLHTDPAIADCAPGQTVHAQGRLFILSGGLDRLWQAYSGAP